jgi:hypothetical protein
MLRPPKRFPDIIIPASDFGVVGLEAGLFAEGLTVGWGVVFAEVPGADTFGLEESSIRCKVSDVKYIIDSFLLNECSKKL